MPVRKRKGKLKQARRNRGRREFKDKARPPDAGLDLTPAERRQMRRNLNKMLEDVFKDPGTRL